MRQVLPLSRAARLAGISRGELQQKILDLGLETFEGRIDRETLLQAYPDLDLESDPTFERVQHIKAKAHPKRSYSDNWLPEAAVLMARLHEFQHVLARTKSALNSATAVIGEVITQLRQAASGSDTELRQQVEEIGARLAASLEMAERHNDREAELFAKDAMLRIVSASVRVLPSKHEFFVQGRDSLLDAGLKAGLHLNYGCASGNCGACKVRVHKGDTQKIREHDYVLSAQDVADGYVLACSNTAVSDLLIEGIEALGPADLPQQKVRCVVEWIEPLDGHFAMLQLRTPRTQTLRFLAGQRVELTLEDGRSRKLALASCPCDGQHLQFLLSCDNDFWHALQARDRAQTVQIDGPFGEFGLQEDTIQAAIFVGVNAGMGPIKSVIEHAIAIDNAAHLTLYRIDDLPHRSLLGNLCRSWNDALDNFSYQRLAGDTAPQATLAELLQNHPHLNNCQIYAAGPTDWIRQFHAACLSSGLEDAHLHVDETG